MGSHQRHSGLPASLARSCFVQDVGYERQPGYYQQDTTCRATAAELAQDVPNLSLHFTLLGRNHSRHEPL